MSEHVVPRRRTPRVMGLKLSGVPIFNYHGLAQSAPDGVPMYARQFWIPPSQFRSHLAHIDENGVRVILLDDVRDQSAHTAKDVRNVALTFDDGLSSDYEAAFPLLAEFGMKATFFLNTATIGQPGYLDWSRIAEMRRHGMSFQSHGHRHVDLTLLPAPVLDAELNESKKRLEDRLGSPVGFIAAPFGVLDRRVIDRALSVGYRGICSTRCLPARPGATVLTRITLRRDDRMEDFHGFLTGRIWPYARRLAYGVLLRPLNVVDHLYGVLRYRWLKHPVAVGK